MKEFYPVLDSIVQINRGGRDDMFLLTTIILLSVLHYFFRVVDSWSSAIQKSDYFPVHSKFIIGQCYFIQVVVHGCSYFFPLDYIRWNAIEHKDQVLVKYLQTRVRSRIDRVELVPYDPSCFTPPEMKSPGQRGDGSPYTLH